MKKRLTAALLAAMLIVPAISAKAVSQRWTLYATNTVIEGNLYSTGGSRDIANASTINISANHKYVYVIIYASANGSIIPGSTKRNENRVDYPKAWVQNTCRSPIYWGSDHSTSPTDDPTKCLTLYVGNM